MVSFCVISECQGVKKYSYTSIEICFNCINKLKDEKCFDVNKLIPKVKLISTICLCSDDKKIGTILNISKEYFKKHYGNNKEVYYKRLNTANSLIEKEKDKLERLLVTEPKIIWLERVEELPINIEEDYNVWLMLFEQEKKRRTANISNHIGICKYNYLKDFNILVYYYLNI